MTKRILRLPAVKDRTGYKSTAIYEKIAAGTFPKQICLDGRGRAVGWLEEEIENWISDKVNASRIGDSLHAPSVTQGGNHANS